MQVEAVPPIVRVSWQDAKANADEMGWDEAIRLDNLKDVVTVGFLLQRGERIILAGERLDDAGEITYRDVCYIAATWVTSLVYLEIGPEEDVSDPRGMVVT